MKGLIASVTQRLQRKTRKREFPRFSERKMKRELKTERKREREKRRRKGSLDQEMFLSLSLFFPFSLCFALSIFVSPSLSLTFELSQPESHTISHASVRLTAALSLGFSSSLHVTVRAWKRSRMRSGASMRVRVRACELVPACEPSSRSYYACAGWH